MEKLPDLVIELINEYLSYRDLASLRVTCKRLKEFVDRKVFRNLNLFVREKVKYLDSLFHTNKPISYVNSMRVEKFSVTAVFRTRFEHLQRLAIFCGEREYDLVHLDDFNCFKDLREIQVQASSHCIDGRLSLKHLQIASFRSTDRLCRPFVTFELDCPRLKALSVHWSAKPTMISDANHLTHLLFQCLESDKNYLTSFYSRLKNLREICFESLDHLDRFLDLLNDNVLRLPSLSAIKLQNFLEYQIDFETFDWIIEGLTELKSNWRTKQIGFYVNELPINLEQLVELSTILKRPEMKDTTDLLTSARLRFIKQRPVCECLLSGDFYRITIDEESELDEVLIRKLRKIRSIHFKNKFELEPDLFDLLLRTWRSVDQLMFENVYIESELLELIAKRLVNVDRLLLSDDRLGDLGFVSKFPNLSSVGLDFNLERDALKGLTEIAAKKIDGFNTVLHGKCQKITFTKEENLFRIYIRRYEGHHFHNFCYFSGHIDRLLDFYYEENLFEVKWQPDDYDESTNGISLDDYPFKKPSKMKRADDASN